jgi:O-methyltransferase
MSLSNELKLEFLKYVIIGRVGNATLVNNWVESGAFPEESVIREIMARPMDEHRLEGLDWPEDAVTMIGLKRMNNLHEMLDYVRQNNIEGDLMETGVWKGGATIFMKLYCDMYSMDKKVFVCDSFAGLPKPSGKFIQDHGDTHYIETKLAISLEQVQNHFKIFKCLDEKVIFIKGFFGETLPNNELVQNLAILRMDGDMYESTYDVFYSCYDKLVDKGVCIIDDFCLKGARDCTHDFRQSRNIQDTLVTVDRCGVYWIKNENQ